MLRARSAFLLVASVSVSFFASRNVLAYCRTTTCAPPGSFVPTADQCEPGGTTSCKVGTNTVKDIPLWWRNACVGYSVQKDAGRYVTLDQATQAAAGAFSVWGSASCSGGAPSISGQNNGPAACADAAFNVYGPNQHVIIFRDSGWPYKTSVEQRLGQSSAMVALTTVSFDLDTGEILDADIELNTADHRIIPTDAPSPGVYDLDSVLTHETGHFLGIAHSPDRTAVMYFEDEGGSTRHRSLTPDDAAAICDVYPPSGVRPVDVVASSSRGIAATACDPAPRGGFSSVCVTSSPPSTTSSGCATGPMSPGAGGESLVILGLAATAGAAARRRSRRSDRV